MQLQQGQKLQLQQLSLQQELSIEVDIQASFNIDLSCFGLDANQKLSDEAFMVFYNQPVTPDGAVRWQAQPKQTFHFQLNLVNLNQIQRFSICAAIDDPHATMKQIQGGTINIKNPSGQILASFTIQPQIFHQEKAIMLADVYFKDVWRLGIVAQGFNGGLAALVEHFGGEVAQDEATPSTITQPVSTPTPPISQPTTTNPSGLNLNKIQLEKTGQSHHINLNKNNHEYLKIEVIWVDNGDGRSDNDDLDLRVGFMLQHQNTMGYVWCPSQQGALESYPYIQHQGDITGASIAQPGKETVLVHPDIAKKLGGKVALVFSVYSAVSNGVVSIASLQPKMRMQYGDQLVECVFNASVSAKAKSRFVYTYVIGVAIIDEQGITLQHSGMTSGRFSEDTPRIIWKKDGTVDIKVDGKPMFK
ncbi:TerD family protein [Acinetobacter piscicola]|uniref:TerD family protein n=1 Tax=Acinetobacter piscicola TaxID=2006115 RepID=UPI003557DDF8